jgi:hypothetical protein
VARRGKRRRLRRLILWIGLLVLIAGFIARRTLVPRGLYYLTHRAPSPADFAPPPEAPSMPGSGNADQTAQSVPANPVPDQGSSGASPSQPQAAKAPVSPPIEKLTNTDRQALDEVLRNKSK